MNEKEEATIHRRQRRKPRFLWTVDLNLRSLRYLLFKIFSDLPTEGNEAKEELVFPRNPNSNFVFLPRNSLQKETKEMKAGLVQQNTVFVFFVIFCLNCFLLRPGILYRRKRR